MSRRYLRRRDRRAEPPPSDRPAVPPSAEPENQSAHFGRAALGLALLLGTLVERAALGLPDDGREIFHFVVLLGIALIATGAYRGFARRAVKRSRERRGNRPR
jgi:DNA-directed RNA polymerase specialized sigma24 family protein